MLTIERLIDATRDLGAIFMRMDEAAAEFAARDRAGAPGASGGRGAAR